MKIFVLLFLFAPAAFACDISMPHRLVVLGSEETGQSPVNASGCGPESIREFHRTLTDLEGRISSAQLTEMLASRGYTVRIEPHMVQIQNLKTFLRDQLAIPAGVHVRSTQAVNAPNFLALAPGDQLQVHCGACLWGTKQVINLSVSGFDGSRRDLVATADFGRMVRAFRLVRPLSSFSEITTADVKEEFTEAVPHTEFIAESANFRYYKTNKPLKSGDLLRQSDLNAMNIVRAGLRTEVILENTLVRIKTSGISRGNGAIGDLVEVYHPQKNKKYQGKVIDNNKVLVEL